jgi:hypothetical protein
MKKRLHINPRSLKNFTVLTLCFCLGVMQLNVPLAAASTDTQDDAQRRAARVAAVAKAKELAFRKGAERYDQAIQGIAAVDKMALKTEADVKKALATLQSSRSLLNGAFGKAVTIALSNTALRAGVEAEADRVTPKAMSLQIKQQPTFASRIRGIDDARSAISRQFASDAELIRRVGKKLQEASRQRGASFSAPSTEPQHMMTAEVSRCKVDSASLVSALIAPTSYRELASAATFLPLVKAVDPAAEPAAVQTGLEAAVVAAVIVVLTAYAARKAADFTEPEDPDNEEDTRSRFRVCMDKADAKLDGCLDRKEGDFFGQAGCWAVYLFEKGECLTLPL